MNRRSFHRLNAAALASLWLLGARQAFALSLSGVSDGEAAQGVQQALQKGAEFAMAGLGKTDGFLGNDKVRIPLPGYLDNAAKMLKQFGQGKKVDELVTAMNRAAEAAVPQAREILLNAVQHLSISDASRILTGGENSVTEFFADKTRTPLAEKFLPIVTEQTEKVGLADKYNAVAGKAAGMGLVRKEDANIQQYVTGKALDGLYLMIGEEEKKIRQDPLGAGSAVLGKVFGAIH